MGGVALSPMDIKIYCGANYYSSRCLTFLIGHSLVPSELFISNSLSLDSKFSLLLICDYEFEQLLFIGTD